jgi:microcystin-dependent protein
LSDQFVAEIRIFPFNFAPRGWAFCDGQLMAISQNTALFSLLGTTYGGDGRTTFALPNLQGSVPMQQGQSRTGTLYDLGQQSGVESITLLQSEMPAHTHTVMAHAQDAGTVLLPSPNVPPSSAVGGFPYNRTTNTNLTQFDAFRTMNLAGGDLPHQNMMQYLTVNFCIALQGIFPPRT